MGLCNTFGAVPNKTDVTSFRLSPTFREAADALAEVHKAKSLADYFRGLIYLDATLASADTDLLDKPSWVTRDYGKLLREIVATMKADTRTMVERQTQIARKAYEQHGKPESEPQTKRHRSKTA